MRDGGFASPDHLGNTLLHYDTHAALVYIAFIDLSDQTWHEESFEGMDQQQLPSVKLTILKRFPTVFAHCSVVCVSGACSNSPA